MRKWYLCCLALLLAVMPAYAQRTVSGTVTDATDDYGIPGVNILIKGTSTGTVTDIEGNFKIEVPGDDAVLVFSYIGYLSQEVTVGARSVFDVGLELDVKALEEVVVVGYGVQDKKDVTGSMESLGQEEFNKGVNTSPEQLIQGKVAGVQIQQFGGEPGSGANIRIRGVSSIRSNNNPLYVIDGVPIDNSQASAPGVGVTDEGSGQAGRDNVSSSPRNPLNFLNPNDIESIDILKDASATAIYGARGANGVIIITTKRGKEGKGTLDYSTFVGVATLANKIDMLSADQYMQGQRQLQQARNSDADPNNDLTDADIAGRNLGANTDWQDEVFTTAVTHSHNLSYSGGTASTSYRASLSYLDQQGIAEGSSMERVTGRINTTTKAINDRLTLSTNLTVSRIFDENIPFEETGGFEGDVFTSALRLNPTQPVFNPDGTYFQLDNSNRNPVAMRDLTTDNTRTGRVLGNLSAEYKIVEGLNYKVNLGADNSTSTRRISQDRRLIYRQGEGGRADINSVEVGSLLIENYITYRTDINENSKIDFLAGHSYQTFLNQGFTVSRQGFSTDEIIYVNNIEGGTGGGIPPTSFKEKNELQSFFGRVNYNLMDKYLVTATFRRDGSTKFGANNKYGNFPSLAFAWRLSEESFIQNLGIFQDLKLRAGWGITGNQEIPNKVSLAALGSDNDTQGYLDGEGNPISGLAFLRTPNENLKWEETSQINIGLDFSILDGRLNGTIDYFNKVTTDMLIRVVPSLAPSTEQWINLTDTELINKGVELGLNAVVIDNGDFSWNANFNISFIDNEVRDLPLSRIVTGRASGQGLSGTTVNIITNGEPIGTFFGKEWLGFDENGISQFRDDDNDGNADEIILGSALPDYTFGFSSTFQYKNWDLNFFFQGVQGNEVYNNTANSLFPKANLAGGRNVNVESLNSPESFDNGLTFSSRYIEDGSFIRLNNATFGYNFNTANVEWLSRLRAYVTGTNLFIITNYSGYDPEVNTDANDNGVPSLGIDYTSYPRSRQIIFGVDISF